MKIRFEQLESRTNPSTDVFGIDHAALYPGVPEAIAYGDYNGDGRQDEAIVAGPGGGPASTVISDAGSGQNSPNPDPLSPFVLFKDFVMEPSARMGITVASMRSADNTHDMLVYASDFGGGPRVVVQDLMEGTITSFFVMDPNYYGGIHLTEAGPNYSVVNGVPVALPGHVNDMVAAFAEVGGAPECTLFNADGLVNSFFVGPQDDRSGDYQPAPAAVGATILDGTHADGMIVSNPDGSSTFYDMLGRVHVDPFAGTD